MFHIYILEMLIQIKINFIISSCEHIVKNSFSIKLHEEIRIRILLNFELN